MQCAKYTTDHIAVRFFGLFGFLVLTGQSEKGKNARIFKNSSLDAGELYKTFPLLYVTEFNHQL